MSNDYFSELLKMRDEHIEFQPIKGGNEHNVLIEFETIYDIDFGILGYINKKYNDDERFAHQLVEMTTPNERAGLIHDNDHTNPVRIMMDIEDYDEADSIYEDIMENNLDDIIKEGTPTSLLQFCKNAISTSGMCNINILCRRKEYTKYIDELFKGFDSQYYNIIYHDFGTVDDPKYFDVSEYTCLFLRHIYSLLDYDNIDGKTVYVQECITNINQDMYYRGLGILPNMKLTPLFSTSNRIFIFQPYPYDNGYFINRNYPYDNGSYIDPVQPEEIDEDEEPIDYDNLNNLTEADLLEASLLFDNDRFTDEDMGTSYDDDTEDGEVILDEPEDDYNIFKEDE